MAFMLGSGSLSFTVKELSVDIWELLVTRTVLS
jgi:hypothetical protein